MGRLSRSVVGVLASSVFVVTAVSAEGSATRPGTLTAGGSGAAKAGLVARGAVDPVPVNWRVPTLGEQPPEWTRPKVVWPEPGLASVKVPEKRAEMTDIADTAVSLGRPMDDQADVPSAVVVDVLPPGVARKASGVGVGLTIAAQAGSRGGKVNLAVDASGSGAAYGGGFLGRLRLARVETRALEATAVKDCMPNPVVLESSHVDMATGIVSADAEVPEAPVGASKEGALTEAGYVLLSGATGVGGTFTATPLSATGSWQVGIGSGSFEYTQPLPIAPTAVGTTPSAELLYSSASVDGMTSADNSQAGEFGAGWQLNQASIDQIYDTASDGEFINSSAPVFRIMLNGQSSFLVDRTPGGAVGPDFALRGDTRWNVHLEENPDDSPNGDTAGRWWRVTTPEGSVYHFGSNRALTVAATYAPSEHQVFTNAWRQAIPYGAGTRTASRAQIEGAARQIYSDYPEILRALGLG